MRKGRHTQRQIQFIAREAGDGVSGRVVRHGRHIIAEFIDAGGRTARCTVSSSASDWRSHKNLIKTIRRGFK